MLADALAECPVAPPHVQTIPTSGRDQKSGAMGARTTRDVRKKGMGMLNGEVSAAIELRTMISAWRALVIEWELTWSERQALLPEGGDELNNPPADTERRMRILVEIGYRLRFDDGDELVVWLRQPSRKWGWLAPLDVMGASLPDLRRVRRLADEGVLP